MKEKAKYELTSEKYFELYHFARRHQGKQLDESVNVPRIPSGDSCGRYRSMDLYTPLSLGEFIISNCMATRAYSDKRLRRELNNDKFREKRGYVSLEAFARAGDPLCEKILNVRDRLSGGDWIEGFLVNDISGLDYRKIFAKIVNREIKEEEYLAYLNGEKPIGDYTTGGYSIAGNRITETFEISLDPSSEQGFSRKMIKHTNDWSGDIH